MSYQELLELTERFLSQQDERFVLLDNETKVLLQGNTKTKAPAPLPAPIPYRAAVASPKPVEKTVAPPIHTTKPKPAATIAVQPQNLKPQGIPCLPRPFVRPELPSFDDIKSKIKIGQLAKEPSVDTIAVEKERAWMKDAPQFALLSFFPKNSPKSQFIETIAHAIHTRLGSCKLFHLPDLETLTELYIYAQHLCLKTCLIASDSVTQAKANEFWLPLNLEEEPRTNELFNKRSMMYSTALYDITVSDTLATDAEQKRELWSAIKQAG